MASERDQELLTRVGPGTSMGQVMRQYWIPAAASAELKADGEPVRLMLLGEQLIGFRDSNGRAGIMDHRCPHRCASLFFGRNEEGGLRCVYHGWKFDAEGNCVDMANVPPHQDFKHKVHAKAYRTRERAGVVWVYMGDEAELPELPMIEATMGTEDDTIVVFIQRESTYLTSLEGSIDTSHAGILHGPAKRDTSGNTGDLERIILVNRHPEYKVIETPYGTSYGAYRPADKGMINWRVSHFLFPFWTLAPTGPIDGHVTARAWVPMDDTHNMSVYFARRSTLHVSSLETLTGGVADFDGFLPNTTEWFGRWRTRARRDNDYLIDRDKQRTETFTGIDGVLLQDQMITESMGGVPDMTWEHLAPSDQMITVTRRRILNAITAFTKDGIKPPASVAPEDYYRARAGFFAAPESRDWLEVYRERLEAARAKAVA